MKLAPYQHSSYKHDAGVCSAAVFHLHGAPRFIDSAMASARYARMIQKEVLEQLTEMFRWTGRKVKQHQEQDAMNHLPSSP